MFTLKPISRDSVGGALAKAERYRLLNEPNEAVSICRDILEVDPSNREAHISMILALTDEMAHDQGAFASAMEAIAGLEAAVRSRLLFRDRVGAACEGISRCWETGVQWVRLRLAGQGAQPIRGSGAFAARRK